MTITVDLSDVEAIALLAFLRSVNTSGVLSSAEHEVAFDKASEKKIARGVAEGVRGAAMISQDRQQASRAVRAHTRDTKKMAAPLAEPP
jgi:hypothetical protein